MHISWHILKILGYVIVGARTASGLVRGLTTWVVKQARERTEARARSLRTACVVRSNRVRLRWYERLAVHLHGLLGFGRVRSVEGNAMEATVDVTPQAVLLAVAARARFSSHSMHAWNEDYQ